jgi:uncharacterized protein (TIRG00374 family)
LHERIALAGAKCPSHSLSFDHITTSIYLFDQAALNSRSNAPMNILLRVIFGVLVGGLLLWMAVAGVNLEDTKSALAKVQSDLVLLALCAYWAALFLRIFRWRDLLSGTRDLRLSQTGRALIAGYAVNNLLPARIGELVRVDYVRRQYGVARSAALGSIILERLADGMAAIALLVFGLTTASFKSEHPVLISATLIAASGIGAIVVCIILTALLHQRLLATRFPWLSERLAILLQAMTALDRRRIAQSLAVTVMIWMVECLSVALLISSFDVETTVAGLAMITGAAAISTIIPSAPAYIGSLQAAFVVTFSALELDPVVGLLSATTLQVLLFGSVTLAGLCILLSSHLLGPLMVGQRKE